MKVLLINKYFYPKGGAEKYFFALRKILKNHGHEVVDFSMEDKNNLSSPNESYFVSHVGTDKLFSWSGLKALGRLFWSLEARKKIKKLIAEERPQLAHLHNIYHQISPSILPLLKKNKIPVIMTVHDFALISPSINMFAKGKVYDKIIGQKYYLCLKDGCVKESFWFSLVSVLEMYLHHKILNVYRKNIDLFICPSDFLAQMLVKAGFEKNKICVLPNFIQEEQISGRQQNEKYFLCFGRLSAEKGINILIEAMRNLPNIKLKIVGSGPDEERYRLQITNCKLDNIEILGYKTGISLSQLIVGSYAVVVPSVCYENCPLSILESMALGKPVISSAIGGIPELITSGDNGVLVKAGDSSALAKALTELWLSEEKCEQMATRALEKSFQYSANRYFLSLSELYKKFL